MIRKLHKFSYVFLYYVIPGDSARRLCGVNVSMKYPAPDRDRIHNCTAQYFSELPALPDKLKRNHSALMERMVRSFGNFANDIIRDQKFAGIHAKELALFVFPAEAASKEIPYAWGEEHYTTGWIAEHRDFYVTIDKIAKKHGIPWDVLK